MGMIELIKKKIFFSAPDIGYFSNNLLIKIMEVLFLELIKHFSRPTYVH